MLCSPGRCVPPRWIPGGRRRAGCRALDPLYLLRGPQTRRDFDFAFFRPDHWGELASRFFHVLGRILGTDAAAAWLPLLAIVLYLVVTRRGLADPLLPILPLQILCYAIAFSVSCSTDLRVRGPSAGSRSRCFRR